MKICPQCKKHFEDTETMCPDCNVELYKLKLKKKKKKKASALKIVLIILATFLALIGLGFLAFLGLSIYMANKIMSSPEFTSSYSGIEKRSELRRVASSVQSSIILRYSIEGKSVKTCSDSHSLVNDILLKAMYEPADSFTNTQICDGPAFYDKLSENVLCVTNFASYEGRCDNKNEVPCAEDTNVPNLYVDTNNAEGPNVLYDGSNPDADIFPFVIYDTKVVPTKETADYYTEKE